jgi:hypothetical protein
VARCCSVKDTGCDRTATIIGVYRESDIRTE